MLSASIEFEDFSEGSFVVLCCNFRSLALLGLLGFLVRELKT